MVRKDKGIVYRKWKGYPDEKQKKHEELTAKKKVREKVGEDTTRNTL